MKEFAYNTNKQLKKEKGAVQDTTQKVARKTAKEDVNSSPASTDLSERHQGKGKSSGAPTDLEDLMSVGIPFQRNGVVYLHGKDNLNNKRKATSALEQSSERHWMAMWKDVKAELKTLREELKDETDGEVKTELKSDIDCLKKKKDEWALLWGMKE